MKKRKLIRFLKNQSTPKETKDFYQWLDKPEAKKELENIFEEEWNDPSFVYKDETHLPFLLKKIHDKILPKGNTNFQTKSYHFYWSLKLAACIAMAIICSYIVFQQSTITDEISISEEPPVAQNIVKIAGPGEKVTLIMPDQTQIILNSLSEIRFDSNYGKTNRILHLKGEAYFEISHNPEKPFKVLTGNTVTTALGTAFNAFSRENDIRISLTEGKVLVTRDKQAVELIPGEMASINSKSINLETGRFDVSKITAWKEGYISLQSKSLKEVLSVLEDWYGVTITVDKNINQSQKISGVFKNENLKNILEGLAFSFNLQYELSGKNVYLKPIQPMK